MTKKPSKVKELKLELNKYIKEFRGLSKRKKSILEHLELYSHSYNHKAQSFSENRVNGFPEHFEKIKRLKEKNIPINTMALIQLNGLIQQTKRY